MENKLISMVDYVLVQENNSNSESNRQRFVTTVINYANFLKQPLTLGMFMPCDLDGNVLNNPNDDAFLHNNTYEEYLNQDEIYQEAKERVIFEGFGIENENFFDACFYDVVRNKDTYVFVKDKEWEKVNDYNTIEDLVFYNLTLTPNAIKEFKT